MLEQLDVAIGFATVMLAVSLIIMSLTQAVSSLVALRGAKLQKGLSNLIEQTAPTIKTLANDLSREEFLDDITRAKSILEGLSGQEVRGYRAPSFSIGTDNQWAFDCLVEAGYSYSSSVYPIKHDHYGIPDAPRFMHEVRPGLTEIPPTTIRAFSRNWPASAVSSRAGSAASVAGGASLVCAIAKPPVVPVGNLDSARAEPS